MEKNDEFKQGYYQNALTESFMTLDAEVKGEIYAKETGSTACVVLITPDKIICANAGDSRAVLFSNNKAIGLSEDHKPDNKEEKNRIEKSGHIVEDNRVDGNLALSRAFGDYQYKCQANLEPHQWAVTAKPDITVNTRTNKD